MTTQYIEVSPSDIDTSSTENLLDGHEADFAANPRYGWFGEFRRSTTAVVFVAAVSLFVDMIVYGIVLPILPIVIHDKLGLDAKSVGFLFGCYAIGLLCATPLIATFSDRYHTRKIPMLFGMFTLAICTILFAVANTYWQLILARIAQGAAGGASWTLSLAMLADRFGSGPKLGVVMGTVLSANTLGAIIGPLVGGLLFEYWGYMAPFIFCAALSLFGFLIIGMIVEPSHLSKDQIVDENFIINNDDDNDNGDSNDDMNREISTQPLSIWNLILDWNIVNLCLTVIVVSSTLAGIEPILPIHLRKEFDASASEIGFIFIAIAIPTFFSPAVGYISFYIGQRKTCGIGMMLLGITTPLISLPNKSNPLWLIILPLLLFGAAFAIVITPILPLLAHYITQRGGGAYGQVYGLWNMSYSVGMFLGPVIAGDLYEFIGFRNTLIIIGVVGVATTPLIFVGRLFRNRNDRILYERVPTDDVN